jgi:hypothetical protein
MSAYSTIDVSRSEAKAKYKEHLWDKLLSIENDTVGDKELEEFMDGVLAESLFNCVIVEHEEDD